MMQTTRRGRTRRTESSRAIAQRLRHLAEHTAALIYDCDAHGRFTYVNPAVCAMMQYRAEELLGRRALKLIRRDSRERTRAFYTRQMLDRVASTYLEFPSRTSTGATIWIGQHVSLVEDGQTVVGLQAVARDITAHRDADELLRQSEAKYRSLIEGSAYGIYRAALDGRILDANPAFVRLLGYDTVDEVLRLNMTALYRFPADRERIIREHEPAAAAATEVEWTRRDGTPITVSVTARSTQLTPNGVTGFESVVEDITAKRALETQLRQAQKMEAVGILARSVAHDFNNVLAAILGAGDLLAVRLPPGDPSLEDAMAICKAAERGATLTRQLLALSRRRPSGIEPLNLGAAVSRGVDILQRGAGNVEHAELTHITLEIGAAQPPPFVRAEVGQVDRILTNLVVNAREAMLEGGSIDVVLEVVNLDTRGTIEYPGLKPGAYAKLVVRDTGVGMSPDLQQHIFEPFFTTKEAAKGAGVGLAIVYGIAKELGGTVAFTSEPGAGTTFEVLIPIAGEADAPA